MPIREIFKNEESISMTLLEKYRNIFMKDISMLGWLVVDD
jgi:hypothetical protein